MSIKYKVWDPTGDPSNASYKGSTPDWPATKSHRDTETVVLLPHSYLSFLHARNEKLNPKTSKYDPQEFEEVRGFMEGMKSRLVGANWEDEGTLTSLYEGLIGRGIVVPDILGAPVRELSRVVQEIYAFVEDMGRAAR